jgi:hypothetical protein
MTSIKSNPGQFIDSFVNNVVLPSIAADKADSVFVPSSSKGITDLGSREATEKDREREAELRTASLPPLPEGMTREEAIREMMRAGVFGQALTSTGFNLRNRTTPEDNKQV